MFNTLKLKGSIMIKVKRVNRNVNTMGAHLVGYVDADYNTLVKAFGKPTSQTPSGDDKVRIEWYIEFTDGTVATVYDWKNYGKSVNWVKKNCTEWHIGGNNEHATNKVLAVVDAVR